jgi:hypothetical protein
MIMPYVDRTKINVSEHIEKKGKFSYLSWVFAIDELQKQDEEATWEYQDNTVFPDGSMMVNTTVTAFGKTLHMLLPVMDHKNNAIKNPDAFAINKAYMRCLAKNVAAHGIGLYIFAGEDIPSADDAKPAPDNKSRIWEKLQQCSSAADIYKLRDAEQKIIDTFDKTTREKIDMVFESKIAEFENAS